MARSINESGSSWVFPDGPLEEIASRCDVITAASLVGSCKFYHDSATQSVALPASQPFGMPCVLHTHQTEVPPAHNPFSRVHKFKQQGAQKDKQHDAKDRKGTLCQLTPLDRISSDAVIPDGGTGMWAGANGDWIALLGFPWNWELVNVYTGRRIPLPPISEFKSTPDKLVFESNDQHLQLLKIAICRVPTAASNYTSFSVLAIFNAAIAVLHCPSSRWTVLDNQFLAYGYSDAIIHKGIVFAVTQTGEVYAWNQLSWGPLLISTAPIPPELDEQGRYNLGSWWLARSPDGSRLFLVHTWGVTDGRDYTGLVRILPAAATSEGRHGRTIRGYGKGLLGCEVYSMDTSQLMPPRPWRRIISLGSYSLFLGVNYPIIIPVEDGAEHDRPNMARSNSVYTSHHAVGLAYPPSPEICRFSLNSEDCTVGFQTNIRWTWRQVPLWLIPSFANARQWNLPSRHRLCRGGGDGHLEALTGDNIDLIAAHLDVTYTVRLAACSRELYDMISKDEGKMHHWDEPCLLMPPPAYWFDEHWDVARASRLHDTVYDLVPLDHPRRSVALPFMHDRKWLGANGDWIAAADHHGWCLVNVYTERHIPLPSLPDSKIRHSIVSYRPAYSFNWGPAIYLLKIVICQVPTKGGRYADYKLIALFDKTIFYLEGGGDWRMLEALTPAPDYPNYCDAIELRGHVFAVDETDGSTYFWDTANDRVGNALTTSSHCIASSPSSAESMAAFEVDPVPWLPWGHQVIDGGPTRLPRSFYYAAILQLVIRPSASPRWTHRRRRKRLLFGEIRFMHVGEAPQNHRAALGFRRGWLMFLGMHPDYRNDLDIANAVGTFGQYHTWNNNDPMLERVLVYASFPSPQLVPRDVVFGKFSSVGGVKESWTAPVYILTADFADILPADEDQMPLDGNPHPLPGHLLHNNNLFANPQFPEVGWDAVQQEPELGGGNIHNAEQNDQVDVEAVEVHEDPESMVLNLSDSSSSSANMMDGHDVNQHMHVMANNVLQGRPTPLEESVPVFTPISKRKKRNVHAVQSLERRFTRSCLNVEGYRPAPILDVQPKIKKIPRAKLLVGPDEVVQMSKKKRSKLMIKESNLQDIPVTPVHVLQRVGRELGIAPEKLTKDLLEADPVVKKNVEANDDTT
ncbi:hypothetical protein QYE76_056390 [Lolium multiflorum]|uniref:KIB1-4 beta-propeller domain-containing protein n=1 Tax=Lolium multiflorum TaxID=4521 RepID=A0AAD8WN54_LOLMU|nr:hypothetical protein QYE76_056390 [Lolium multiflorum]